MPLFGGRDGGGSSRDQDQAALAAVIGRLGGLPLPRLAAEVMAAGFGPQGPGAPGKPGTWEAPGLTSAGDLVNAAVIAQSFRDPAWKFGLEDVAPRQLAWLVAEGLDALQRAGLVRMTVHSFGPAVEHWVATRRGRSALGSGTVEESVGQLAGP